MRALIAATIQAVAVFVLYKLATAGFAVQAFLSNIFVIDQVVLVLTLVAAVGGFLLQIR